MSAATSSGRPYSAIVLGATGNVGGQIVRLLVASPLCRQVTIVTRRQTRAFTDAKVHEVVVDMDHLETQLAPHCGGVDIALAAFGVGKGSATMPEADVRRIEVEYPLAFCRAAKAGGARVGGVMTATGADVTSRMKYVRIIGEKEQAVRSVGFEFLGIYRPAVILGNSNTPAYLEALMPLVHWMFPRRFHSIHRNDLARAMVARSERAFAGLPASGPPGAPVVEALTYSNMHPYFVPGDRDDR